MTNDRLATLASQESMYSKETLLASLIATTAEGYPLPSGALIKALNKENEKLEKNLEDMSRAARTMQVAKEKVESDMAGIRIALQLDTPQDYLARAQHLAKQLAQRDGIILTSQSVWKSKDPDDVRFFDMATLAMNLLYGISIDAMVKEIEDSER